MTEEKEEFAIEIILQRDQPSGCRVPKTYGRFTNKGLVRIETNSLTIMQYKFGWSYYLSFLLGPLGYFLAPIFGSFTYHVVLHKMRWKDILFIKSDKLSQKIKICSIESDGSKWHWVVIADKKQDLVKALRHPAKIHGGLAQMEQIKCQRCGYVLDEPDWQCPECFYEFDERP